MTHRHNQSVQSGDPVSDAVVLFFCIHINITSVLEYKYISNGTRHLCEKFQSLKKSQNSSKMAGSIQTGRMNKQFVLTEHLKAFTISTITDYLSSLGGMLASLYCSCRYSRNLRGWTKSWEASCSFTVITLNPINFNRRTRIV